MQRKYTGFQAGMLNIGKQHLHGLKQKFEQAQLQQKIPSVQILHK